MSKHSAAVVMLAGLALAGCRTCPDRVVVPEIVKVPVREYVPVPDKITRDCAIARAESRTVEAVVSAYNANITSLEACNADKAAIRKLGQDTPAP